MQYYTVKELAELAGVTIKTLHHYHKIGLLEPCKVTESGYRLYSMAGLERLQQILFYRELDFSLKEINRALADEPSRIECLKKQYGLLCERRERMNRLLKTLEESIDRSKIGERMDKSAMFKGFNKEEWNNALTDQNDYINTKYGYDMLENQEIDPESLNKKALEAKQFTDNMIIALKNGWRLDDTRLRKG